MITNQIKLTENYWLYAKVFGVDVLKTQSHPIESTQGTYRTTNPPRTRNLVVVGGQSSALRRSTVIRLSIPSRRSTRLTPPTPIPTTDEAEDMILQDIIQLSLAEQKSHKEYEARENADSSTLRNDDNPNDLGTRFMPRRNFNEVAQRLQEIMLDSSPKSYSACTPTKDTHTSAQEQQYQLYLTMRDNPQLKKDDISIWLALKNKFERLQGENSAKRQKTSKLGMFLFGESSSGQDYESEPGPSKSVNQDQYDDFDFYTNSYATDDDDVLSNKKVPQELMDDMSQTVDEAKLCKVVNEMLRQQCTSGDEHKYHIDQMQNFSKSDIVWESIKDIIVLLYQPKHTSVVQSRQRDPKAYALTLVKQDLLYLKKGNTGSEKIALSLYKFLAVRFLDNDIEERTSKWLGVESYQQNVKLTAPTITFYGIEEYEMFSIVTEPVYGIIYKNSKKEKRAMRQQKIHKFCDATLKRVLEGLKSYNNDVKYGYVTSNLSKEDVEYLQMFAKEIEERLKHRDQIRRWEMYVNGIPPGSRREHPE
nr:hypothetical protein [Tanacetum cinerariifolium]